MSQLPDPLVPLDCDLRNFEYMPLELERLRKSKAWLLAKRQPELGFYMVNLWGASWHNVPAASLEDDDDLLADLAMCPFDVWPKVRDKVLHGWVKCSDGRLYHPVVAEKAITAFASKHKQTQRTKAASEARWKIRNGVRNGVRNGDDKEGKKHPANLRDVSVTDTKRKRDRRDREREDSDLSLDPTTESGPDSDPQPSELNSESPHNRQIAEKQTRAQPAPRSSPSAAVRAGEPSLDDATLLMLGEPVEVGEKLLRRIVQGELDKRKPKRPRRRAGDPWTPPKDWPAFWEVYPNHRDEQSAIKAFIDVTRVQVLPVTLVEKAKLYAAECKTEPRRTHKTAVEWLRGHCWKNEPLATMLANRAERVLNGTCQRHLDNLALTYPDSITKRLDLLDRAAAQKADDPDIWLNRWFFRHGPPGCEIGSTSS